MEGLGLPKKICVVTGARSDYGLLKPILTRLKSSKILELQIIACNMHLSKIHGDSYRDIEADGFHINVKVPMLDERDDSGLATAHAISLGVSGFAKAFHALKPDTIVLLGDRYELLSAASSATVMNIPIAHICGGDITEGAFDNGIRNAVTQLSSLHFVTNEESKIRLLNMGIREDSVFNFGSPGIDNIMQTKLLSSEELTRDLGIELGAKNLLITFHPVTRGKVAGIKQFEELLKALHKLNNGDTKFIFTGPNSDPEGITISKMINHFVEAHSNAKVYTNLGSLRYLSLMAVCDVVVGNSSSGLYEAPTLKTPTVNIGDRQQGRLKAASVIDCEADSSIIAAAINRALNLDCSGVRNPYGEGDTAQKIVSVLER
jgi:UDP-N-acetylglucosamine 2-epimerase (non-hydrolysing)/GDP/UDP-N,N'-diacetylbacillosamine 2-epimerase (hydrolysing)